MRILVLCTGNSCRSQMAEGWLGSWNSSMTVESAGTKPAEQVNKIAIEVMLEVGVNIEKAQPKNVQKFIGESWDFVISVCKEAAEMCPVFEGTVGRKVYLGVDDPDKIQGSEEFRRETFRRVRDELRQKLTEFYVREVQGRELPECEGCSLK